MAGLFWPVFCSLPSQRSRSECWPSFWKTEWCVWGSLCFLQTSKTQGTTRGHMGKQNGCVPARGLGWIGDPYPVSSGQPYTVDRREQCCQKFWFFTKCRSSSPRDLECWLVNKKFLNSTVQKANKHLWLHVAMGYPSSASILCSFVWPGAWIRVEGKEDILGTLFPDSICFHQLE